MTCDAPPMIAGPEPDPSPGAGGGGPSAPSNPNGLCEHPFIEGIYVPCDEVICSEGFVADEYGNCVPESNCFGSPCCDENGQLIIGCINDIPCDGDPLKNMDITSSGASGKNGGRYGCTRGSGSCTNGKRVHDGLDLTALTGTYVFTALSGKVVDVKNSFEINEYAEASYGNYVTIETTMSNGTKIRLKYNHLDYINAQIGQTLGIGMLIGRSGTTGNASSRSVTPHVHIQARYQSGDTWYRTDPEEYLSTEFDNDAEISSSPCN